jgi:hypothetical protein
MIPETVTLALIAAIGIGALAWLGVISPVLWFQ